MIIIFFSFRNNKNAEVFGLLSIMFIQAKMHSANDQIAQFIHLVHNNCFSCTLHRLEGCQGCSLP